MDKTNKQTTVGVSDSPILGYGLESWQLLAS
jgi:hypothetical protein